MHIDLKGEPDRREKADKHISKKNSPPSAPEMDLPAENSISADEQIERMATHVPKRKTPGPKR